MLNQPVTRRTVMAGAAIAIGCGLAGGRLDAVTVPRSRRLFGHTALANNRIASRFEVLPAGIRVPTPQLHSGRGVESLAGLNNPATMVSLWADWCVPCLAEMHDIDGLRRRHQTGFAVIALLQGSQLDLAGAKAKLGSVGAPDMPAWIEPRGAKIVEALATPEGAKGFTLPCNLLIDRHGRVRGRALGVDVLSGGDKAHGEIGAKPLQVRSAWATPAADQFAEALAGGLLDRI